MTDPTGQYLSFNTEDPNFWDNLAGSNKQKQVDLIISEKRKIAVETLKDDPDLKFFRENIYHDQDTDEERLGFLFQQQGMKNSWPRSVLDVFVRNNIDVLKLDISLDMLKQVHIPCISHRYVCQFNEQIAYIDEVQQEEPEEPDDNVEINGQYFCDFVTACQAQQYNPTLLVRDLGLMLPHDTITPDILYEFLFQIQRELTDACIPRIRQPVWTSFNQVLQLLKRSRRIIFLTGAGISVASGIPDFRSKGGIYSQLDRFHLRKPTDMFDLDFFKNNPRPFFTFAPEILPQEKYKPTLTHKFISHFANSGKVTRVYTQNIDCLEVQAGIPEHLVVNCHGSFANSTCQQCKKKTPMKQYREAILDKQVPLCKCCNKDRDRCPIDSPILPSSILKPDIVFFGEKLPDDFVNYIDDDVNYCDLLIIMGSTLKVKPIAGLVGKISRLVPQILINKEHVAGQHQFDFELLGNCDIIIGFILNKLGLNYLIDEHNQQIVIQQEEAKHDYQQQMQEFHQNQKEFESLEAHLLSKEVQDQLPNNGEFELPDELEMKFRRHTELQLLLVEQPKLKPFVEINVQKYYMNDSIGKGVFKITDPTSYYKGKKIVEKMARESKKCLQEEEITQTALDLNDSSISTKETNLEE